MTGEDDIRVLGAEQFKAAAQTVVVVAEEQRQKLRLDRTREEFMVAHQGVAADQDAPLHQQRCLRGMNPENL